MGPRRVLSWVVAASALAFAPPVRAQPVLGPSFEIDARVPGSEAWGDQVRPRVAASPSGTLVLWGLEFEASRWMFGGPVTVGFEGALLDADGMSTRVAPFGEPHPWWVDRGWDVAATAAGFVVVYRDASGIVAQRLDPAGVPFDEPPRVLVAADDDVMLEDVDCDSAGACLAVIRNGSSGPPDDWETIAFGWDIAASSPEYLALALGLGGLVAVAHGPGGFVVAYLTDVVPETPGVGGRVRAQRFDAAGAAAGAPLDLETEPAAEPVLATGTTGGYAIIWTTSVGPVVRAARLDAEGALVATAELGGGVPADDGWPAALVGVGDDARVYWAASPFVLEDVRELVLAPDGTVTAGPMVAIDRVDSAGYDGQHVIVADGRWDGFEDGEDVIGGQADGAIALLSTADNSQYGAEVIGGLDGGALLRWRDNRAEPSMTLAAAIRADGCPAAPVEVDEALSGFWFAAHGGYLALMTGDAPQLQRIDTTGRPIGDAIDLPLARVDGAWPEPRGGLALVGDTGLVLVDADAAITALPQVTGFMPYAIGHLDDGTLFAIADDPPEMPYTCIGDVDTVYSDHASVRILSATGTPLRTAFVAAYQCGSAPRATVHRDGVVLVWRDDVTAYAGRLAVDGTWTGPVPLSPEVFGEPTRVGDELWWLAYEQVEPDGTGVGLAVARTTLDLEPLSRDPLPVDVALIAPKLIATARAATLFGIWVRPPPDSNLRLVGHRLDGGLCRASPPAGDVGPLEPDPHVPADADAGCGCRTGSSADGGLLLLTLMPLLTAVRRGARPGSAPRCVAMKCRTHGGRGSTSAPRAGPRRSPGWRRCRGRLPRRSRGGCWSTPVASCQRGRHARGRSHSRA